ncbi:MAG: hypothetical protein WBC33_10990, partial [Conexibacter sp.]
MFAETVRAGRFVLGTFVIELPARGVVDCCARAGLDFAILDLEHSAIDVHELSYLIACCRANGIGAIVRIEAGALHALTRVLDMAPDGVMVPA